MRYKNAIKGKQTNRLSSFKFNLLGGIKYPDVSHYFPTLDFLRIPAPYSGWTIFIFIFCKN